MPDFPLVNRLCLLLAVGTAACGADPAPPSLSIIAQAPEMLTIGSDTEDDVTLRLGYEDEDGDVGGGVIFIVDCRDDSRVIEAPIPTVASAEVVENEQPLSGELIALVPDIPSVADDATPAALCNELDVVATEGELVMCARMQDSAGNESNGACSAPFTLITQE